MNIKHSPNPTDHITRKTPLRIAIIGGSGLGDALHAQQGKQHFPQTPFGHPSSPITLTQWQGVEIAILQRHGQGHIHNPSQVPYRANIFALKQLGVTHIIASGATGSLRQHIHPGNLVIPDQIIDKTTRRANTFYEHAAVHVELAQPFCPIMRSWLLHAAAAMNANAAPDSKITIHDKATYITMEGPAFSTQAESNLHRAMGGDLIGMTAMPEARLAREAEIPYALIALPTDYDCWQPHPPGVPPQDLLNEIIGNLRHASQNGITLIKHALSDTAILQQPSPAQDALKLAIWTDKSHIPSEEIQRLAPLWGRYFP